MRRFGTILVTVMVVGLIGSAQAQNVEVRFSPQGGVSEAIVKKIDQAKSSVRVEAPLLTAEKIAKALVAAQKRDVKVQVILDKAGDKAKDSQVAALKKADITVLTDSKHTINSRNIIIDDKVVLTGSFSLTQESDGSVETLLILRDEVVAKFVANFAKLAKGAAPLESAKATSKPADEQESETSEAMEGTSDSGEATAKGKYVYSKGGKTYHLADCPFAKRIKEENRIYSDEIPDGKSPCKKCIKE